MITSVSQPPSVNFSSTVTTRIVTHSTSADEVRGQVARTSPDARRGACTQKRVIAEVRERERHEHVDRVHDDERRDVAARVEQRGERGAAHEQHAVAHREPLGERGEAVRQPGVDRHVRHDARAVDEARLRGDEEQRALAEQRGDDERTCRPAGRRCASRRRRARASTAFIVLPSVGRRRARAGSEQDAARGDAPATSPSDHRALARSARAARA